MPPLSMKWRELVQKKGVFLLISILVLFLVIVILGCLLAPDVFYDQWIWKYYWGPVVADATGHSVSYHGVVASEGYTILSEITYGFILIMSLYGIYKLLKRLKIVVDWWFCVALMPYILFGPITRVLEDTGYYTNPFVYWFISPLIYLQIAAYVIVFIILWYAVERHIKKPYLKSTFLRIFPAFLLIDGLYTMLWVLGVSYGDYILHPLEFFAFSLLAFLPLVYFSLKKRVTLNVIVFCGGLLFLLPSVYVIGRWIAGFQWGFTYGARFDVFLLIIGLVALICGAVYLVAYTFRRHEKIAVYKTPLNLSLFVGHMIDGLSSYISIYDPLRMGLPSYLEKHPASNILMEFWPPLFPIVKFLLIVAVIYLFDVLYKTELKQYQTLVNLLKIGIFILGVSPGIRDLLRVTMGV